MDGPNNDSNLSDLDEDPDPAAEFLAREESNLAGLVDDPEEGPAPVVMNGHDPKNIENIPREEPEKIRRWREEQKKRLETKDAEEERKKKEMKEGARKELEEWYASHEEQVAKNRTVNRSAEKELVADTEQMEPGTEWERIAKLCDFNPKGSKHQKDISRMRSIILQMKQTPPASLRK